ncbi:MAG: diguanylate cyclase domain-containing protein [Burkholderiales bacterium]
MFNLLRNFTVVSLFGIGIGAAVIGVAYREFAERDMVELAHARHVELAAMLMSNTAFKVALAQAAGKGEGGQTHPSLNTLIGADLPLSLIRVHAYDAAGRAIFSTEPDHRGEVSLGERIARSVLLPDPADAEGGVVASTIPLDPDHASVVLKLYSDVGLMLDRIARTQLKLVVSAVAALGLLYAALLVIVARADRLIKQHSVEKRSLESRQRRAGHYDVTTGLPNHALFRQRLRETLASAAKEKHFVALLLVEFIHDAAAEDGAMDTATRRLTDIVRNTDTLCRMGDNEFAIVLDEISGRAAIAEIAEKIVHAVRHEPGQGKDALKTRIGISLFPVDATHADMLLRGAGLALQYARQSGKTVAYYQPRKMIAPVSMPDFPVVGEVLK